MRILNLFLYAIIATFLATPAMATECANAGTAPAVAPDDTGDGNATACGRSAVAGGGGSTALGYFASSPGTTSTALGRSATSDGNFSIALGYGAYSAGDNSAALGFNASSEGSSSTALGYQATSAGDFSTSLGYAAASGGLSSTALGADASSSGISSIALGVSATSTGESSTALGYSTSSDGDRSTALGYDASSVGLYSMALGITASSAGDYSSVLGQYASSAGSGSIALGYAASSSGISSIALGYASNSTGNFSTALGVVAYAQGVRSTALGWGAYADQPDTVILGSIAGVNGAGVYANVGMGTSSPSQAVDVERSGAAARFQLTSFTAVTEEAPQYIQRRARGTHLAPTAVQNNDNLGLFSFRGYNGSVMGGSRATITAQAAGNFTDASTPTRLIFATTPVGQTTPQQVLVITPDGKVQVNGQNLTVPDYVFEDDYELMPLEELQAFIDENGHLPGIAPAHEVESEGLDLAGSHMSQLQKIEELTLYTLQQQERIDRLEELVNLLIQERDKS